MHCVYPYLYCTVTHFTLTWHLSFDSSPIFDAIWNAIRSTNFSSHPFIKEIYVYISMEIYLFSLSMLIYFFYKHNALHFSQNVNRFVHAGTMDGMHHFNEVGSIAFAWFHFYANEVFVRVYILCECYSANHATIHTWLGRAWLVNVANNEVWKCCFCFSSFFKRKSNVLTKHTL